MPPRLFHVSEEAGVARFDPRPPPSIVPAPWAPQGVSEDCVWAVDRAHLRNYLFPRDCPRITWSAGPDTTEDDRARFLFGAERVAAIEHGWFERLRAASVWVYELPPGTFRLADAAAGYWVSTEAVTPLSAHLATDLIAALIAERVELRLLQDFWSLADAVTASSLEYSIIRARNARPRSSPSGGSPPEGREGG
jgi:hypothetical protein